MANYFEGKLSAAGKRYGIVAGRFNSLISQQLVQGAIDCLERHGANSDDIDVAWVPGSFELPIVAQRLAESSRYNAVICLGVLVRGHTPHFEYIASVATRGIAEVGTNTGIPTTYGVITADTLEQAIERGGTKAGNKGWEAAQAAIEMVDLLSQLPDNKK